MDSIRIWAGHVLEAAGVIKDYTAHMPFVLCRIALH